MLFKKVGDNLRVQSGTGGEDTTWELAPSPGGHTTKVVNYMVVIKQKSSTAVEIGVSLYHGPNGRNCVLHSTPISSTAIGAGVDLVSGDADTSKIIGEWLHPRIICGSTGATVEWAVIDVYEMRKPF